MIDEIYELEKKFIQLWEIEPVNFALTGYYYLNDKIQIKDKYYPQVNDSILLELILLQSQCPNGWSFKSCRDVSHLKFIVLSNLNWEAKQDTQFYRNSKTKVQRIFKETWNKQVEE